MRVNTVPVQTLDERNILTTQVHILVGIYHIVPNRVYFQCRRAYIIELYYSKTNLLLHTRRNISQLAMRIFHDPVGGAFIS